MLLLWFGEKEEPQEKYGLNLTNIEEDKGCITGGKRTIWLKHGDEQLTNEQSWVICLFRTQCERKRTERWYTKYKFKPVYKITF